MARSLKRRLAKSTIAILAFLFHAMSLSGLDHVLFLKKNMSKQGQIERNPFPMCPYNIVTDFKKGKRTLPALSQSHFTFLAHNVGNENNKQMTNNCYD